MVTLGENGPPEEVPSTPRFDVAYDEASSGTLIGQGGNADVYKITVERPDQAIPLAIKQPRIQQTLTKDIVERFTEETRVWKSLDSHDYIVNIVDADDTPVPWIAMEYMDGGTLGSLISEEQLPFSQAVWVGLCVTRAVRHAHRHGVAHHDIKPANVLFRQSDTGWMVPKVSDWGLARMMLEETNSVAGLSPQYAAPEQFDADTYGSPDDQTDIYQLGVLLYELFTGRPPFDGSPTDVMQSILTEDPKPPSSFAEINSSVDNFILKALERDKKDRYDSVVYIRDKLEEIWTSSSGASIGLINNPDDDIDYNTNQTDAKSENKSSRSVNNSENSKKDSDAGLWETNGSNRRSILKYGPLGLIALIGGRELLSNINLNNDTGGDSNQQQEDDVGDNANGGVTQDPPTVGLVYSLGGLGDNSFNDYAQSGLYDAADEFNADIYEAQPEDSEEVTELQREYANSTNPDFDLVSCVGFNQTDALKQTAPEFPNQEFMIVDSIVEEPNVASYVFKEHEGAFLMGVLAAEVCSSAISVGAGSASGDLVVGFIGGVSSPVIRRFQAGYEAGVEYVSSSMDVMVSYVGSYSDPMGGQQDARSMYQRGADVIFHAAGATGVGIFQAAQQEGGFALGTDIDQSVSEAEFADIILASMVKNIDTAVYECIRSFHTDDFQSGSIKALDLSSGGVECVYGQEIGPDIPTDIKASVFDAERAIIDGDISVPDGG